MARDYQKINTLFMRDENKTIIPDQYTMEEFKWLENNKWECTEKIDGTNMHCDITLDNRDLAGGEHQRAAVLHVVTLLRVVVDLALLGKGQLVERGVSRGAVLGLRGDGLRAVGGVASPTAADEAEAQNRGRAAAQPDERATGKVRHGHIESPYSFYACLQLRAPTMRRAS